MKNLLHIAAVVLFIVAAILVFFIPNPLPFCLLCAGLASWAASGLVA